MYFNSNIAYGMLFHEDAFPIYIVSSPYPLARSVFLQENPELSERELPLSTELEKMEASFPIQLIKLYDSEHHGRHFVVMALKDNIARSSGEFAVSVKENVFQIDPDLLKEAKEFCVKYKLPPFDPEWLLFS